MEQRTEDGGEHGLTGLSGFVADVIDWLGEAGIGILTLVETVFPPIPSEVILPLGGYLAGRGDLSLPLVLVAATVGSTVGALLLYLLGYRVGAERAKALLARLPLVDRDELDAADDWFQRHGSSAVFFGRLVPGVRSLVSLPAGAERMPLGRFTLLTVAGSTLWNTLLIGGGAALGRNWQDVERYATWLDRAFIAVLVVATLLLVRNRLRKRRAGTAHTSHEGPELLGREPGTGER